MPLLLILPTSQRGRPNFKVFPMRTLRKIARRFLAKRNDHSAKAVPPLPEDPVPSTSENDGDTSAIYTGPHKISYLALPRIVPLNTSRPWKTLGLSRTAFFNQFSYLERQTRTLELLIARGDWGVVENVRRRLAAAKQGRIPYSVEPQAALRLIEALEQILLKPPSMEKKRANRAPRLSDVRDLIEGDARIDGSDEIATTTASLAGRLGCSKSTVHKALQALRNRGIVGLEPHARGTRIKVLRFRRD